jgi:hypothetical protein
MKRASYRAAIFWIAANDDTEWVGDENADTSLAIHCPSVTASLVADLFDVDTERVRLDVRRELARQGES